MKTQRLLIALTVVNLALFMFSLARQTRVEAQTVVPVLRGRALEIVDAGGKVRASISVMPGDPAFKMPDGTVGYSETVLLRLITSKGRPNVKIEANEGGSGAMLAGDVDPTHILMDVKRGTTSVTLSNQDGRVQEFKP